MHTHKLYLHPLPSHLLDVITIVARHSVYAATEVSSDVQLPLSDGCCLQPVPTLDCYLVTTYPLCLSGTLSPLPSELGLPLDHSLPLSTTALLTWALALGYGLASHAVRDTFPELLKQLHCVSLDNGSSPLQANRDKALLCLVEAVLRLVAITPEQLKIEGTTDTHPPPAVDWSHPRALLAPLLSLTQWLTETTEFSACTGRTVCWQCAALSCHILPSLPSQ
ncbi:uncharacterized protein LOC135349080 isoform X2 [Halichondria panicea]|uniref:uncharacterized protein LOC135349080 isoform X2 n=1 Tax=Halichondria panicea TaxID=6063 RepID=UPI00312B2AD1